MRFDIEDMPLEIKVGQMIMVGFKGAPPPEYLTRWVEEGRTGGVILFGDRSATPQHIRDLTASLQEAAVGGKAGLPLLIATDQEGGRVGRLTPPLTGFPSAAVLGATGSKKLAAEMGRAMAEELMAVGVNVNFAPVLDVLTDPLNPVIGDRALSSDPDVVADLGSALIGGMQEQGVLATAKHFPGHGDTSFDSHQVLGAAGTDTTTILQRDVRPFQAAVNGGVGAVMTAHVIYPALDAGFPATFSKKIITGMLRGRLGHQGLVITDDMDMGAVTDSYLIDYAARAAVSAGVDIVLVCNEKRNQEGSYEALLSAVKAGDISESRINSSLQRILNTKKEYAGLNYNMRLNVVNSIDHNELVREIENNG